MKREIIFDMFWGLTLCLLFVGLSYSISNSAEEIENTPPNGDIEISISSDSIHVNLERGDIIRSISVSNDSLVRTSDGISVRDELIIGGGRIILDGVELGEDELRRLKINQDEEITPAGDTGDKIHRQYRRKRLATAYGDRGGDIIGFSAVTIDSSSSVMGDAVSVSGDIIVFGEVIGDVVSVFGDVYIREGAIVRGDVAAPFGQIHKDPGVRLRGDQITQDDIRRKRHDTKFDMYIRFNRVEGFALGSKLTYDDSQERYPSMEVGGSYAFSLKRWQYKLGIEHRIGKKAGPYFDLSMYQAAETSDRWILSETANTIKALIFSEDAFDYYSSRGFSGEGGIFIGDRFKTGMLLTATRITNLSRNTKDGLFGGKDFRPNWATALHDSSDLIANEGDLKEYGLTATYDSRDDQRSPSRGLFTNLQLLRTADTDSADFDYALAHYEIKGYLPVLRNQTVMMRLRAGHSDDRLPLFRRFYLGGIGSLRGYDYKEFEGNRYALFNADYAWLFHDSDIGAGVFFDAGKAAFGEDEFESAELKTDIGICFLVTDVLRIDLAQRLDDLDKSPVASFRFDMLF
jgi:hypothetical protein